MNPEDRSAAAFQRLEHAMDTANDLIGELIRRLDDGRPRLRVLGGGATDTDTSAGEGSPRLHIVDPRPRP